MATPSEIRRLAFQVLFQLDLRGGVDAHEVRASLTEQGAFTERERSDAFEAACAAWGGRAEADAAMLELAPGWPTHRQAAVDRAILRLAHHELTRGTAPPKSVINDAVELAKAFSTERSPAFVNALLDRIMKRPAPAGRLSAPPEPA
ncbi:MAG: transcription antitermination factor NusB [Phycisphaerae bacterium]|nr:transcription antitermination factor NusB [Phycisphaerae bacterium]